MRTAPFHDLQADTIGGVIDSLDVVVDWARENGHRLGYFAALRGDFDLINDILASLTDGVQDELARVWPALRLLDRLGGRIDEVLAGFGLVVARSRAWEVAGKLAAVPGPERPVRIGVLDRQVAAFGERILAPGLVANVVLLAIRLTEMRSVRRIIEILE